MQARQRFHERTHHRLGPQRVGFDAHHVVPLGTTQTGIEGDQLLVGGHLDDLLHACELHGLLHLLVVHQLQIVKAQRPEAARRAGIPLGRCRALHHLGDLGNEAAGQQITVATSAVRAWENTCFSFRLPADVSRWCSVSSSLPNQRGTQPRDSTSASLRQTSKGESALALMAVGGCVARKESIHLSGLWAGPLPPKPEGNQKTAQFMVLRAGFASRPSPVHAGSRCCAPRSSRRHPRRKPPPAPRSPRATDAGWGTARGWSRC
ncbi:hypothetical protein Y695_03165 [Hydrogenophaga sp. T4]|nr:hypothetical protein Y695_03165 [Hydrogenophaga sp. T4]